MIHVTHQELEDVLNVIRSSLRGSGDASVAEALDAGIAYVRAAQRRVHSPEVGIPNGSSARPAASMCTRCGGQGGSYRGGICGLCLGSGRRKKP